MDSSATAENRAAEAPAASDVKPAEATPAVADNAAASSASTATTTDAAPASSSDAAPVVATESAPETTSQKPYYATADLGLFNYSNSKSAYDGVALPNPAILRIGGGYRFGQRVSVEAGYSLVGDSILKSTGSVVLTETVKAAVLHVALVDTYSINGKFDVFGKLGLVSTKLDYSYASSTTVPASGSGSGTSTNLMFGVGAQYNINKRYSVRAQYEDFGKTKVTAAYSNGLTLSSDIGVTVISVGGVYNF
jgi:OOP family OmpA-OmpF porin